MARKTFPAHRYPRIAPLTLITLVAVAVVAPPASAAPSPATRPPATSSPVVSGQARFEVLSPTLIRTEYAGDSAFLNAATFNALGRDGFTPTPFTARTSNGWLTIKTSALSLRYQVGSGAFTDRNLTVSLRSGRQPVTAAPWATQMPASCAIGTLCEAEALTLAGPAVARDHTGYTGQGFAAGFTVAGQSLSFVTEASSTADQRLDLRYANATGGDGNTVTRTLSVSVDFEQPQQVSLPPTGSWDTWALATATVHLTAGRHTVTVLRAVGDSGNVNLDSLAMVAPGAAFPSPTPPTSVPCPFDSLCEAEAGDLAGGAQLATDHSGYSGQGFLAKLERPGASTTIQLTGVPSAGRYQLQLRYANAAADRQPIQARTMSIQVGSSSPTTRTLAATSSWDSWRTVGLPVDLAAGANTVVLGCPEVTSCYVNLDTVAVTGPAAPLRAPHAALGGYRRSLDGVNGSAVTTPGLLYTDGWSLLNDTASAVYDPANRVVTPRPTHGNTPYQDGYVFGYGQDYQRGLRDLATLTGPSTLLPRWAYGVWYSEYYDRTAADFQNTIVPRFRAEGIPLDVLVVDTDFKASNLWNGWSIDPDKFPDPTGFNDWAHQQGLRTTFNVHPSIMESDPRFGQAQLTARGKLTKGACSAGAGACYVFDFGDPDQLAAYLELHTPMERQGVDFWWLDWCCDQSWSSQSGVTADAWINQQYAVNSAARLGRGFAFSRAFGSLQAGGYSGQAAVSTGPWADKRTTLHFTGDVISSWESLRYEVGYTPGESVATGLAAVSHDIGGHTGGTQLPGAEPGTTKLPDDLYARWVQLGTFQPIDRLHSNHSDRLPWQYGTEAAASATKFLNLRERLLPYTYTLARQASVTGTPIVQPLYLTYPDQQEAYANAGSEYLYGPDVLVAPAVDPGSTATTSVWFPPGSSWTDYFTGRTYQGGTTQQITTGLDTMPVFLRSGGVMVTRTGDVTGDEHNPLTAATVTVAEGENGTWSLFEDDGSTADAKLSTSTKITYTGSGCEHQVTIDPARGGFAGQIDRRTWTVSFANATAPSRVLVNGHRLASTAWSWHATTRTVTVHAPAQPTNRPLVVSYR